MDVRITPTPLQGTLSAIASKSHAHRLAICAALSDKPTTLTLQSTSVDIDTTLNCLSQLGASVVRRGKEVTITPGTVPEGAHLNCMESGSTFRFLLPVATALCQDVTFTGCGRLPQRPIDDLRLALEAHGVDFSQEALPFTTKGLLQGGTFPMAGNVSSQYITGLLLALPRAQGDSRIELTTPLQSAAYVDITIQALRQFGIVIHQDGTGYTIPGNQTFRSPGAVVVDGDWSNAAFFLVAGALGKPITLTGLDMTSTQGDKGILALLERFGARVVVEGDAVTVSPDPLHGCTIDIDPMPDALPILAVLASCAQGTTHFVNAGRLRLKESDRLVSTAALLQNLGGAVEVGADSLTVHGTPLTGGTVDSFHDHRIAMAGAVAALGATGAVTITNAQAVDKSYPTFFADFTQLGGVCHVV